MTERMFAKSRSKPTSVSGADFQKAAQQLVVHERVEPRCAEQFGRGNARGPPSGGAGDALDDRAVERDQAEAHRDQLARMRPALFQRAQRQLAKSAIVGREPAVSQALGEKDLARHRIFELERTAGGQDRRPGVTRRHIGLAEIFVGLEQIGF